MADSKNFELEINQLPQQDGTESGENVRGAINVYTENNIENQVWVVFRKYQGDHFLFNKLFEKVLNHPEI